MDGGGGADGNENSASVWRTGTLCWFCYFRLNCLDKRAGGAAVHRALEIPFVNAHQKCGPSKPSRCFTHRHV